MLAGGLIAIPRFSRASQFSRGDDIIKIALIGCGARGTGAAAQALATKQNVKLVALADAFRDNLDNCYQVLSNNEKVDVPEAHKFTGFDAYTKAIALADVVILTTPPGFRPIHFEEAIKQGKHVFMEKPVAVDPAGIQKVLAAAAIAKQKKLNVVVGLQRRYQNSYRALFRHKDMIGRIISAQAWWNMGGVWFRQREAGQTEMEFQMRSWYYFNWLCGDHINEQHVHNLDIINWFKGAHPVSAQGMGGREVRKGKDTGELFDHHSVEFTYADGSTLNSQCRQIDGTMSKIDELLIGTKGRIQTGAGNIVDHTGKVLYQFSGNETDPYQTEHDELFAAVANGEYKFDDAEHGASSTMTAILGRMATYSGQVIEWDQAIKSGLDLQPQKYGWDATPPVVPNAEGLYPVAVPGVTSFP